jgi:integrase
VGDGFGIPVGFLGLVRKSIRGGHTKLQPASINRQLSLLRRADQLGYERKPQLVDKIPPIKKLAENNIRKGFITPEQYQGLLSELPEHLRPITCIAFHVANRKGELLNLEWSDVAWMETLPSLRCGREKPRTTMGARSRSSQEKCWTHCAR